jgi:hypothetical protein
MTALRQCKCGCGCAVLYTKRYVDKSHQLTHMRAGEASRLNRLQPSDAKRRGGVTAGRRAAASGELMERGRLGAGRAHKIATSLTEADGVA